MLARGEDTRIQAVHALRQRGVPRHTGVLNNTIGGSVHSGGPATLYYNVSTFYTN